MAAPVPCSSVSSGAVKAEAMLVCMCSWLSFSFHSTYVMDALLADIAALLDGTSNLLQANSDSTQRNLSYHKNEQELLYVSLC